MKQLLNDVWSSYWSAFQFACTLFLAVFIVAIGFDVLLRDYLALPVEAVNLWLEIVNQALAAVILGALVVAVFMSLRRQQNRGRLRELIEEHNGHVRRLDRLDTTGYGELGCRHRLVVSVLEKLLREGGEW